MLRITATLGFQCRDAVKDVAHQFVAHLLTTSSAGVLQQQGCSRICCQISIDSLHVMAKQAKLTQHSTACYTPATKGCQVMKYLCQS